MRRALEMMLGCDLDVRLFTLGVFPIILHHAVFAAGLALTVTGQKGEQVDPGDPDHSAKAVRDEFVTFDPTPNCTVPDIERVRYLVDRVEIEFVVPRTAAASIGGSRLPIA